MLSRARLNSLEYGLVILSFFHWTKYYRTPKIKSTKDNRASTQLIVRRTRLLNPVAMPITCRCFQYSPSWGPTCSQHQPTSATICTSKEAQDDSSFHTELMPGRAETHCPQPALPAMKICEQNSYWHCLTPLCVPPQNCLPCSLCLSFHSRLLPPMTF